MPLTQLEFNQKLVLSLLASHDRDSLLCPQRLEEAARIADRAFDIKLQKTEIFFMFEHIAGYVTSICKAEHPVQGRFVTVVPRPNVWNTQNTLGKYTDAGQENRKSELEDRDNKTTDPSTLQASGGDGKLSESLSDSQITSSKEPAQNHVVAEELAPSISYTTAPSKAGYLLPTSPLSEKMPDFETRIAEYGMCYDDLTRRKHWIDEEASEDGVTVEALKGDTLVSDQIELHVTLHEDVADDVTAMTVTSSAVEEEARRQARRKKKAMKQLTKEQKRQKEAKKLKRKEAADDDIDVYVLIPAPKRQKMNED